jgi:Holliday junction resolvase-like predicted endonuclease
VSQAESYAELTASQRETQRLLQEQIKEAEQRKLENDLRFKETERLLKEQGLETDRRIREVSQEIQIVSLQVNKEIQAVSLEVRQLSQQVNKEISQVNKQIGDLGGKWGRFVENMVAPACETLFLKKGIPVHQVAQRLKRHSAEKTLEIDILVTNEAHVLVVEVKSTLGVTDVKEFIEDLSQFRLFFPEYAQKDLYGAVAGIEIEKGAAKFAYRQGLFVLAQSGETVTILNDDNFQPKCW